MTDLAKEYLHELAVRVDWVTVRVELLVSMAGGA